MHAAPAIRGESQRVPNRWIVPIGAVLVHVCIGSVYAWSTFNRPIQALLPDAAWWFSPPYTTFTTALALLGLSAAFGGPWVERRGPRAAAAAPAAVATMVATRTVGAPVAGKVVPLAELEQWLAVNATAVAPVGAGNA